MRKVTYANCPRNHELIVTIIYMRKEQNIKKPMIFSFAAEFIQYFEFKCWEKCCNVNASEGGIFQRGGGEEQKNV